MTFLRSLWSDLVEKRLWPFAAALLVALVAVPVVLGAGGPEPVAAPIGVTGATGAVGPGAVAQVALAGGGPVRLDRAGRVRDPFVQRAIEQADAPTAPAGPASGATGGSGAATTPPTDATPPAGGGGGGTTPAVPSTPTTPTTPRVPEAPDPRDAYEVVLRIGRAGVNTKARSVERLTPLPSTQRPFIVHLGVLTDERTAIFLVSSDVTVTGDGKCRPRRSSCETLELRADDVALLSVAASDGSVTRFRLEVLRIEKDGAPIADPGRTQLAKQSSSGATRAARQDADGFDGAERYLLDEDTGLFRARRTMKGLGGHLPDPSSAQTRSAGGAPRAVPARENPEEPTWYDGA